MINLVDSHVTWQNLSKFNLILKKNFKTLSSWQNILDWHVSWNQSGFKFIFLFNYTIIKIYILKKYNK
jgi:hypothetical protein